MKKFLKDREVRDIIVGRIEDSRDLIAGRPVLLDEHLEELKRELQSIIQLIDELKK